MLGARSQCWNKWWVCPSAAIHTEVYTEVCVLSTSPPEGVHNMSRSAGAAGVAVRVPWDGTRTGNFWER